MWRRGLSTPWWLLLGSLYAACAIAGAAGWFGGPRLGLEVEFAYGQAVVTHVHPGGIAWEAGVRPGDVLLTAGSVPVTPEIWAVHGDAGGALTAVRQKDGETLQRSFNEYTPMTAPLAVGLAVISAVFAEIGRAHV